MMAIRKLAKHYEKPSIVIPKQPWKGKEKEDKVPEDDIPILQENWYNKYQDLLNRTKGELPPLREINHEIDLINDEAKYTYHLPRCPVPLQEQFYNKLNRYVASKWWEPQTSTQAAPLMCIPKKDGRLHTVIDTRQLNDKTIKDVTPLPDQEIIWKDVARTPYRSKIDLSDAYEQVRVRPEDVRKTSFTMIAGTYISNIVQQGDCNAPATFQQL